MEVERKGSLTVEKRILPKPADLRRCHVVCDQLGPYVDEQEERKDEQEGKVDFLVPTSNSAECRRFVRNGLCPSVFK